MAHYYYFMTSLPLLSLTMSEPPSIEGLWSSSEYVLSSRDRELIEALLQDLPSEGKGFFGKWQEFQKELNYTLMRHRASSLGRSLKEAYPMSSQIEVWQIAQGVFSRENPLERELYLIDQLFSLLNSWSANYSPFGLETFMIYLLQLKLIHRFSQFKQKLGEANFDQIYRSLRDKILNNDRGIL
jgi:hypothetical protein